MDDILDVTNRTFDLAPWMGTLLRDRFRFSEPSDIRCAYSSAFYSYAHDIDAVLEDRSIDALNTVRNLIVHKLRIPDQKYRDEIVGTPAPVPNAEGHLPLDGGVVIRLINPVNQLAFKLVVAVDKWIDEESAGRHIRKSS